MFQNLIKVFVIRLRFIHALSRLFSLLQLRIARKQLTFVRTVYRPSSICSVQIKYFVCLRLVNFRCIGDVFYLTAVVDRRMVTSYIRIFRQFGKGELERLYCGYSLVKQLLWKRLQFNCCRLTCTNHSLLVMWLYEFHFSG